WVVIDNDGTWAAGTQPYPWTVKDDLTDTLRIKIEDAENPGVATVTTTDVRIIGKITLDKPDTSEPDWLVGESADIKFTTTGTYSVLIEGSTNGFANEDENWTIVTIPSASITSGVQYIHPYTVEDHLSTNAKIRVSDAARPTEVNDISFKAFTLKGKLEVTKPITTDVLKVDKSFTLEWKKTGSIANVKIEYSTDGSHLYSN
ncbi:MAG: hypothetical protein KAV18_01515, partial [Candidatus Omnitrophica bacterium]|nr:hypothetical protein [Candidatus Omnitrophota bacterium]